ncbi:hypothetical protein JQ596_14760 [Bradyrhizobium manausense]|uniref:hypothetical protein n=1 Tax=Bradyrhizobium TaxID=374 RepID=UPI001BA4FD5D|nr:MULTISPECIES: hypothetical protein [Bradyrhizobium]MBR0826809.1 hypothetical protein [Bradyrhizobium manausense]UVO32095.1 hypothetical protein KUF59_16420 [Bradyrhizobium arachidis]
MQIAIAKRRPKRRCRIPRRPHPDLDFFFGRLEHADREPGDDLSPELVERDAFPSPCRP